MKRLSAIVAKNLIHYRELRGVSQSELASKAGISRTTLSRYERPEGYEGITLSALAAIASALDVEETDLVASGEPPEPVRLKPDLWDAAVVVSEAVRQFQEGDETPLIDALLERFRKR